MPERTTHEWLARAGILAVVVSAGSCTSNVKPDEERQATSKPAIESPTPPDSAATIVGAWAHTGDASWPLLASVIDSDRDGCPEVLASAGTPGTDGWHLLHGPCEVDANWLSYEVAEREGWAGLIELRGVHGLVEWRQEAGATTLSLSCGMLDQGVWRSDAKSSIAVDHARPVLLSAIPTELEPDAPGFVLIDRKHELTWLQVTSECELELIGHYTTPSIQLLAADWRTGIPGGSVSLCLSGSPSTSPMVSCAEWSREHEPHFVPLEVRTFIAPDFALTDARDYAYALRRLRPILNDWEPSVVDVGFGEIADKPSYVVGLAADDVVLVATGEPNMEGVGLVRFSLDRRPATDEIDIPFDGKLLGLVPTRVDGAPAFVVLSATEHQVRVNVLRVDGRFRHP